MCLVVLVTQLAHASVSARTYFDTDLLIDFLSAGLDAVLLGTQKVSA
jgi:hypothetical protein